MRVKTDYKKLLGYTDNQEQNKLIKEKISLEIKALKSFPGGTRQKNLIQLITELNIKINSFNL